MSSLLGALALAFTAFVGPGANTATARGAFELSGLTLADGSPTPARRIASEMGFFY